MSLNCPLEPNQRVIRNSHTAYNRTTHLYFLDGKFQLVGICCSWLYPEETNTLFFAQDPIWPILGGLGGNNSGKQGLDWAKILTAGSPHGYTSAIWSILKSSFFYRDRTYPKLEFLVQLWPRITTWKWLKSKIAIVLSKSVKIKALSFFNFPLKL